MKFRDVMISITFWWFFTGHMNTLRWAHHRIIHFPVQPSFVDIQKAVLVVLVFYCFLFQMRSIQFAYLKIVESRLQRSKEIVRRNKAEPRTLMYYERTVLRLSSSPFRSHFRLTKNTFSNICNLFGRLMASNVDASRRVGLPNTPIKSQILPVLWLLATPESYRFVNVDFVAKFSTDVSCLRFVADRFDISKGTLYLFINRLVDCLNDIPPQYIRWPRPDEMPSVRRRFFEIARFDHIDGAVDGTFVVISAPKEDPEEFRTLKHNFAVTLQAICLATLQFTSCFAGFPASVGDRRIFENSPIYRKIQRSKKEYFPNDEFIIGDKAYPVYDWCQAQYIRRHVLNDAQEIYNRLLSSTLQVIERSFGLLFGRFRRLKFLDMSGAENIPKVIMACCVLHNLCLSESNYEDFIEEGLLIVRENSSEESESDYSASSTHDTEGQQRRGAARLLRGSLKNSKE